MCSHRLLKFCSSFDSLQAQWIDTIRQALYIYQGGGRITRNLVVLFMPYFSNASTNELRAFLSFLCPELQLRFCTVIFPHGSQLAAQMHACRANVPGACHAMEIVLQEVRMDALESSAPVGL